MSKKESFDFKVIKRIPLSKSIASKSESDDFNSFKKINYINLDTNKNTSKSAFLEKKDRLKKEDILLKDKFKNFKEDAILNKNDDLSKKSKDDLNFNIKKLDRIKIDIDEGVKDINTDKKIESKENKNNEDLVNLPLKENNLKKEVNSKNLVLKNKEDYLNINEDYYYENYLENLYNNLDNNFFKKKISKKKETVNQFKEKDDNIDDLIKKLNEKTKEIEKDVFIESFSFLESKPKVKKIKFDAYKIKNLYSKIDDLSKKTNQKNISINNNNEDVLLEEIELPEISVIEDDVKDIDFTIDDKLVSKYLDDTGEVKTLNEEIIHSENKSSFKNPSFVLDENRQIVFNKDLDQVINYKQNNNKLNENTNKFSISEFNEKIKKDEIERKEKYNKINFNKKDDEYIKQKFSEINKGKSKNKNKINIEKSYILKKNPKLKKELNFKNESQVTDYALDYLTPKDVPKNKDFYQDHFIDDTKVETNSNFKKLVYNDYIFYKKQDIKKISEKYSIDDFTYVNIYYDDKKGLLYNLIQPNLTESEKQNFEKIKKSFFNSIDKDYFSFKGDKYKLENYIQKTYDLSLSRLSLDLSFLEKKLFFKFIQRAFFGLGILTNILKDKKILEVSCYGAKSNIAVYHIDYGLLKTNISFENISDLNDFVINLTKKMGLFITENHPVIDGYLPNGYKVEGLYSLGDTSSKGSSFVIKKYLEEPLSPISLINTGIGSIDVFAYIWSAISQDYNVILVGNDTSYYIFNSVLLFYPNKKIVTVQSYDRLKLPQKEWINKITNENKKITKKVLIDQSISQKPDYLIVDYFDNDVFNYSWNNINLFSIDFSVYLELLKNIELINHKIIVIEIKNIKKDLKENIQIISVKEIKNNKENHIIEIDINKNLYNINLLSSEIDLIDFSKKQKIIKWMFESKIHNYIDFNNIVSEFNIKKDDIFKRLNIK